MKVLQQLIQHFWMRGVLAIEEAHYLVESGFIRPGDLEDYEPRPREDNEDTIVERELPAEIFQTDELELKEEELSTRAARRKRTRPTPKVPEFKPEDLAEQLRIVLAARAESLPALVELASRRQPCSEPGEAAILLRQLDEQTFNRVLLDGIRSRPGLLAELWESIDPEPFHVVAASGAKGRVARAFQLILRAAAPEDWGPAAWLLQVSEVQAVTNLLAGRRRLLAALVWLYDQQWSDLARCLQRPTRRLRSWRPLGHGFVLLHNARAHVARSRAQGYSVTKQLNWIDWEETWTVAMALDAAAVTPYFIHVFGSLQALPAMETLDPASRPDVEILCPPQWKI